MGVGRSPDLKGGPYQWRIPCRCDVPTYWLEVSIVIETEYRMSPLPSERNFLDMPPGNKMATNPVMYKVFNALRHRPIEAIPR